MRICASISRFARNFSDCMTQIAALKTMHPAHPIGVYFETENIYTLNPSSQYSLDIQALLADWESGNKSRRMILSYDQRIMTGQYPVADLMGYRHKDITSLEFVENIFRLMNWNRECRYKVLGRVANSDQGLCMLFDLEEAIMFTPKPQEYADPLTGEMKKKQMKFFPDTYRNRIGKSYNDYIADHQMNMFEDFIGYQGSAVLDEPVREEDSFSKESMSQESEISENILLPDLAKQSESIEQQSGEIAERGMPT